MVFSLWKIIFRKAGPGTFKREVFIPAMNASEAFKLGVECLDFLSVEADAILSIEKTEMKTFLKNGVD